MHPMIFVSVLTLGVGALFGCSLVADDSEGASESLARDGVDADLQAAKKAVNLIAGTSAKCISCHTAGRDEIRGWGESLKSIEATCLSSTLTMTPLERINCLKDSPADADSQFSASKLGLYAAGAALQQFEDLFKAAYSADEWQAKFQAFKDQAAMPAFNRPGFSSDEFGSIKSWVLSGMPKLDDVMAEPGAFPCEAHTTPELVAHMAQMRTDGWGARLAAASTPMAGCGAATTATACLTSYPDLTATWGATGTQQMLRNVRTLTNRTSWWVRSSPDGKYSAFGGSPSRIIDTESPTDSVTVDAPYDPGFMPNNDGFSYAGTSPGGIRVCKQSVLLSAFAGNHHVTFSEPGCSRILDTVYQSVGAALDGSIFFMVTGTHTNDNGSFSGPVSGAFGATAVTTVTPMINDGTKYVPQTAVDLTIPFEGDQQMSPSNKLLITRFGSTTATAGYHIRTITPTFGVGPNGAIDPAAPMQLALKDIGTVCIAGGKPQISFDERFLAVHEYVDSTANPQGLPTSSSNIFVVDLKTGKQTQVTKMGANQRALYPHWRADGWLYFLVRDNVANKDTLVASDVALRQL
jgi:hypothetical protein